MSVAAWSGSLLEWENELTALKARLAPVFGRAELRASASGFIDGLLSGISRKTGWQLAEQAGQEQPYRMQSLLGRSAWDADALREKVRDEVLSSLGDPCGVLVVDETGFLKKGTHSVGVARQYSGTAGRVENCQVGVFLAYASPLGQALIDRRLYLPEAWTKDTPRCRKAGVPETVSFATKTEIARTMIGTALDANVPCAWVLADALYGSDSSLRRMLEARRQPYVLAVRSNLTLRFVTPEGYIRPIRLAWLMTRITAIGPPTRPEGTKRDQALRLDPDRLVLGCRGRLRALGADPARPKGSGRAGLLSRLRAGWHQPRRTRWGGRAALDHRGMFPACQGGTWPRSLRSSFLAWLAPAHDAVHGGGRFPDPAFGSATPGGKQ